MYFLFNDKSAIFAVESTNLQNYITMKSFLNLFKYKGNKEELPISLAPKVITEESEKEKIKPYLDSLIKAINTKDVNNVAITGSYGSGKSTILKTFQEEYKSYFRLKINP